MHATTTGAHKNPAGQDSELGGLGRTLIAGIDCGAVLLVTGEHGIGKTAPLNRVRLDVEVLADPRQRDAHRWRAGPRGRWPTGS